MPSSPVRRGGRPATPSTNGTATITAPAPQPAAVPTVHAEPQPPKPVRTIEGLLRDPVIQEQMRLALPKHMTAERLARIALTEVRKNPRLAECDQASFLGACMQCAQLGLEPGGAMGHAYLIPFRNRSKGITEVQFIVGYRGMIDLARRSGQIVSIDARPVYEADQFEVRFGLDPDLIHVPAWGVEDRGQLQFVYAVAKLKDGGVQFDVMSRADVERIRKRSRSANDGPWVTDYEAMALKTVLRRLFKYLPVSIELTQAVVLDEQSSFGKRQDNPLDYMVAPSLPAQQGGHMALPQAQPAPKITPDLYQSLTEAIGRRLTVVGEAALTAELEADGIGSLLELPVDRFDALMRQLADNDTVRLWNYGQASDGEVLLSDEQMAALTTVAETPAAAEAQLVQAAPAPAATADQAAGAPETEEAEDGEQASFV